MDGSYYDNGIYYSGKKSKLKKEEKRAEFIKNLKSNNSLPAVTLPSTEFQ
jgi:hypothetical protein